MKNKPQTLEELSEKFNAKITMLREKIQVMSAKDDQTCIQLSASVDKTVKELQKMFTGMRAEIERQKEALAIVEDLRKENNLQINEIEHMSQNVPRHLPNLPVPDFHPQRPQAKKARAQELSDSSPVSHHVRYMGTPLSSEAKKPKRSSVTTPVPSTDAIKRSGHAIQFTETPAVPYLTIEEFNVIPKYMKGRHTYEQVNRTIDEFNKAVTVKYKLMRTPKSRQNEPTKRHIREYKQQETNETKGQSFIIDKDLTAHSNMKLDGVGRAMLTMLRHCRRIKEVRGKGLTRYVLIPSSSI